MAFSEGPADAGPAESAPVELALGHSNDAMSKVEACAEEISAANAAVQKKIADGATTLSAHKTLAQGRQVEGQIQEVAADLHQVAQTLTKGIEELKQLEVDLSESRSALAESNTALAATINAEKEARQQALHDLRTGLPNRDLFDTRFEQAIAMAKRHGWTLALMFLDLDGFKHVNDSHGHPVGDVVLKEIANRLSRHAREEDTVCRNGGDEFLYLLVNPQGTQNIERIARNIVDRISQPLQVENLQLVVRASIGIAIYPDSAPSAEALIGLADLAMYQAKRNGTGFALDNAANRETAVL